MTPTIDTSALDAAREELAALEGDLPTLQALAAEREATVKRAQANGRRDYAQLVTLEANAQAAHSLLAKHERHVAAARSQVTTLEAGIEHGRRLATYREALTAAEQAQTTWRETATAVIKDLQRQLARLHAAEVNLTNAVSTATAAAEAAEVTFGRDLGQARRPAALTVDLNLHLVGLDLTRPYPHLPPHHGPVEVEGVPRVLHFAYKPGASDATRRTSPGEVEAPQHA